VLIFWIDQFELVIEKTLYSSGNFICVSSRQGVDAMSRKIIICNDHNWLAPQYRSKKRPVPGNATLAHNCLSETDQNGNRQISLLQSDQSNPMSVGQTFRRLTGVGLRQEILDAYRFLVHNYISGDEIYLLGAGRGAFAIQCLAEMVSASGLLLIDSLDHIAKAYIYGNLDEDARAGLSGVALKNGFKSREVDIAFVGCWDAVGSKGTPTRGLHWLSRGWTEDPPDALASNIQAAYQALALDETNKRLCPSIWTDSKNTKGVNIQQVWFSGKHQNVVGGQRDCRLSDIAFSWLVNRAEEHGLHFDTDKMEDLTSPDPMGCLVQDRKRDLILQMLGRKRGNRMPGLADSHFSRKQIPATEKIHFSVMEKESKDQTYFSETLLNLPQGSLGICGHEVIPYKSNRRHDRIDVNYPVTLMLNQSRFNGNMVDFSEGGAKIWLHMDVPVGTKVTVKSAALISQELEGEVVWTKDQSLGLAFAETLDLSSFELPPGQMLQ
jgi:T6SS, Phospholipase effector Tle1-like, catalytic domain/PilZ domain